MQLDQAAPMLADGEPPIMVAKINADKYRSAVAKYDIRSAVLFFVSCPNISRILECVQLVCPISSQSFRMSESAFTCRFILSYIASI